MHFLTATIPLILFCILSMDVFAQNRNPTIEESWDQSWKKRDPAPVAPSIESGQQRQAYPAWESRRSPESRPWPSLPTNPGPDDYFRVNSVLIDSLSNLYCLSQNYIRTLTNRNAAAHASHPAVPGKDFSYSESASQPRTAARESLEAIYRELNGLLEQCLYGR